MHANLDVVRQFIDRHLAEGRTDKVAILAGDQAVTYGQLAERVNRCGNALRALGLAPGERILLVVKDCPEFFYLFWGSIKAGLIPVPVNTLLRAGDYRYMVEDSRCAAIAWSPQYSAEIEPALEQAASGPAHRVLVGGPPGSGDSVPIQLHELMEAASAQLESTPADQDDDCFWLYSSGSTGRPKAAVHAHRAMAVTSQRYGVETLGLVEDDVCFSAAKLFFAYGMGNAMTFPLWVGATTVLFEGRPTPAATFDVIARHKATVYFGVPTLYAAQLGVVAEVEPDLSSLRLCVSAGEALPAALYFRWLERTGLEILDGIGSTELLHIFLSNREGDVTPGSSGRTVPGYRARIVDEEGMDVGPGESGRLLMAGQSLCIRYHDQPERTAAIIQDGWIDTGDTYREGDGGAYVYCGRNDDMLKVGGIWCSPFEIESQLISHAKVLEVAVVGRRDDHDLIKPEAWVVTADSAEGSPALAEELLHHCKAGLAPYKYPRWFHFVDELPKTATGKIRRFMLRN